MTKRVIDISEEAAHLCCRHGAVRLELQSGKSVTVPASDIESVVLASPQCTVSRTALALLASNNVAVIVADDRRLPVGMLLPLVGHSTQTERFALQALAPLPVRKRAWRAITQAKILGQASVLEIFRGDDRGLAQLANTVKSGDARNVEAVAARRYWAKFFSKHHSFARVPRGPWPNPIFDYGYGILRSMAARAAAASGLHPSIGIHHHNRYDSFCLANDLMEPYRPIVDSLVIKLEEEGHVWSGPKRLSREHKLALLEGLAAKYRCGGKSLSLSALLAGLASSLTTVLIGESKRIVVPRVEIGE